MPLVALLDSERVEAFRLNSEQWADLRTNYKTHELIMVCGSAAVPKISPRGVRFFAHKPRTNCTLHLGAVESEVHLRTKAILAEAARQAGWNATIEAVGPGGSWIADVLVHRGNTALALEAQWSPQRAEEFESRSARYLASGVHCRWFLGPRNHAKQIPHSCEIDGTVDELRCRVPDIPFEPDRYLKLDEAARLLLGGMVRARLEVRVTSLALEFMKLRCYSPSCRQWYSRWWVLGANVVSRCGANGYIDGEFSAHRWRPFARKRIEQVMRQHVYRLTDRHDWPTPCRYERRSSERAGHPYVMAVCPWCDRGQGDAFLFTSGRLPATGELTLVLDADARESFRLAEEVLELRHLCGDCGRGQCSGSRTFDSEVTFPVVEHDD